MSIPYESFDPTEALDLPAQADLSSRLPPCGNQSHQSSCLGWVFGYGLSTYALNSRDGNTMGATSAPPASKVMSPAYVFNLVHLDFGHGDCHQGVGFNQAISVVCERGIVPWSRFPYDTTATGCTLVVPEALQDSALFPLSAPVALHTADTRQWRYHLQQGRPIALGIAIDSSFHGLGHRASAAGALVTWPGVEPEHTTECHAVVCAGYNDGDSTFLILNSWGERWGLHGYLRIPYAVMRALCYEAYTFLNTPSSPEALAAADRADERNAGQEDGGALRVGGAHAIDGLIIHASRMGHDRTDVMINVVDPASKQTKLGLHARHGQALTFFHAGEAWRMEVRPAGLLDRLLGRHVRYRIQRTPASTDTFVQQAMIKAEVFRAAHR